MAKTMDEQIEELETKIEAEDIKAEEPVEKEEVEQEETEEPEKEGETKEEVKEEVKEEKPKEEKVAIDPHLAYQLREEKRRREELERKVEELSKPKTETKETDPAPNPEEDPVGYLAWENRQLRKNQEEFSAWKKQTEEQKQQEAAAAERTQAFFQDSQMAKTNIPDLEAGIDHLFDSLKNSYKAIYPTANPMQIGQAARNQMLTWGEQYRKQHGLNSAHALYMLSQQSYGYSHKEPEPVVVKEPKASLATIEKNKQKSGHGLGTGTTKSNVITPEAFAKMSIADIEENKDELTAAGWL